MNKYHNLKTVDAETLTSKINLNPWGYVSIAEQVKSFPFPERIILEGYFKEAILTDSYFNISGKPNSNTFGNNIRVYAPSKDIQRIHESFKNGDRVRAIVSLKQAKATFIPASLIDILNKEEASTPIKWDTDIIISPFEDGVRNTILCTNKEELKYILQNSMFTESQNKRVYASCLFDSWGDVFEECGWRKHPFFFNTYYSAISSSPHCETGVHSYLPTE